MYVACREHPYWAIYFAHYSCCSYICLTRKVLCFKYCVNFLFVWLVVNGRCNVLFVWVVVNGRWVNNKDCNLQSGKWFLYMRAKQYFMLGWILEQQHTYLCQIQKKKKYWAIYYRHQPFFVLLYLICASTAVSVFCSLC